MQSEVKDLENLVETLKSSLKARDEHLNALSHEIEYLNMRLNNLFRYESEYQLVRIKR